MRRLIVGLAFAAMFAAPWGAAGAQQQVDLTQTVVMYPQKYTVSMPDGWTVQYRKAIGKTEVVSENTVIGLYTEEGVLSRVMEIDETTSTGDVLVELYDDFFDGGTITRDDVRPFDYGGKTGHIYLDVEGQIAGVMRLEDATFVLIRVDGAEAFTEVEMNTIMAIIGSATAGNNVSELRDPSMAFMGEPCFVSVPEGANVRLRVGPGYNRAAIDFLGPDTYKVYGQIRTDDGIVWYKLDPWQVVPEKDAQEVWVEARDVLRQGDCDLVASASAPPLIEFGSGPAPVPGIVIPPDAGVPPSENDVAPVDGTYTLSYGSLGSANCMGQGSTQMNFNREQLTTITGALFVRNNGAVFVYADILFVRGNDGDYVGAIYFSNGTVEFIRLTPVNPNYMRGYRTQNFGTGENACSVSVPVVLSR